MAASERARARHKGCGADEVVLPLLMLQSGRKVDIEQVMLEQDQCKEGYGRAGKASWRKGCLG